MKLFHRILAAVDLSENSEYVRSWAEGLVENVGNVVDYVGVFQKFPEAYLTVLGWNKDFLDTVNRAKEEMFRSMSETYGGVGRKVHEIVGEPDREIVGFADRIGASLIIMGFRGTCKSRIPIGSTALGVVNKTDKNVLLVGSRFQPLRRIAVSHAFKPMDRKSLLIASALAKSFAATLYRVHVIDTHYYKLIPEDLREELVFEVQLELSKSLPGVDTVPVVLYGDVPMELSYWAAKNDVDLLIIGSEPGRLGLVAQEVLMQTSTNVMVCRGLS